MGNSMNRLLKLTSSLLVLAAAACGAMGSAQAADLQAAPVYKKAPAVEEWNPWMLRVRALGVLPDAGGSSVHVTGVPALSSPNSGLTIGDSVVPELDISYFFTKNIAAELILGVTRNPVGGTGTPVDETVAHAWLFPPTVLAQYHFTDFGAFKPYIGAGVNYTVFFNQSAANQVWNGLSVTDLHISNAWGGAVQFGFDYMLDRHWGLNVDVKKLWLRPDYSATVNGAIPITGRANVDPWLVGLGVTYKF
jgi:outer membrane protein